jgi:hypothetical protein
MTLNEVEQRSAYRARQLCNPDVKERKKTAAPKIKPSKLSSITIDRIGREYETTSGVHALPIDDSRSACCAAATKACGSSTHG